MSAMDLDKAQPFISSLGGSELLFVESRQEVYHLNDFAAYLWRSLARGMTSQQVLAELVANGVSDEVGRSSIRQAQVSWAELSLSPCRPLLEELKAGRESVHQQLEVLGVNISIAYCDGLEKPNSTIFSHLEAKYDCAADIALHAMVVDDLIHLYVQGQFRFACLPRNFAVLVKGEIMSLLLQTLDYEVAIHAASLVQDGRLLLLSGPPGAGKTTFAIGLSHNGLAFAGDDVALLRSDGHFVGVPFAPACKSGSWPLVKTMRADLMSRSVFWRSDRKRVRYLLPPDLASCEPREAAWLLTLNRKPGSEPDLAPISPIAGLRAVLDGAAARGEKLTGMGFKALSSAVQKMACFRLTYDSLPEAVQHVREYLR